MQINIKHSPTETDIQRVCTQLINHNLPFIQDSYDERIVLDIFDRDSDRDMKTDANNEGQFLAGLVARIRGAWLEIEYLSVADSLREQGIGSQLMRKAETIACKHGCRFGYVKTFSFQAQPFYEKLGYQVAYTLEDYPDIGFQTHHMQKVLPVKI
jgi:GNAT superfamily N-acetyltransferase